MSKVNIRGANANNGNTVPIPQHGIGDVIVIFAYRSNSATPPSTPVAGGTVPSWAGITANSGGSFNSFQLSYCVATADDHTSGTWTNANGMIAVVLDQAKSDMPIGGYAVGAQSVGTSLVAPAVTLVNNDGSSALLHFFGLGDNTNAVSSWAPAPTGYTQQAAQGYTSAKVAVCLDSKNDTTSDGAVTQVAGASAWYRTLSLEIVAAENDGAFFMFF